MEDDTQRRERRVRPAKQADTTLGLRGGSSGECRRGQKRLCNATFKVSRFIRLCLIPGLFRTDPSLRSELFTSESTIKHCNLLPAYTCYMFFFNILLSTVFFYLHFTVHKIHKTSAPHSFPSYIKTQTSSGARTLSQSSKKPFCPSQPWLRRSKESASQSPFDRGPQPIEAHNSRYCSYKSFKRNSSHNSASLPQWGQSYVGAFSAPSQLHSRFTFWAS
jgi:hypothetical protein